MSKLLELQDVWKEYKNGASTVSALRGVTVTIDEPGQMVVLLGPSGSGKTTLLSIIGALDRPTRGRICIEGQDLSTLEPGQLVRMRCHKVGFVFQAFNLIPNLTAMENVEISMEFAGVEGKAARRRASSLLDLVGLGSRASHTPSRLSGGEQQRTAIARALANSPDLLLADEPTGNLDSHTGEEIVILLKDLVKNEGKSLVIVTHDARLADLADIKLQMQDGRVTAI